MDTKQTSILLDDYLSDKYNPSSRIYENPQKKMVAHSFKEVEGVIYDIEKSIKNGFYVVTLFSYELGELFNGLPLHNSQDPLIIAWSFESVKKVSQSIVEEWLAKEREKELLEINGSKQSSGICNIHLNSNESEYQKIISEIHKNIRFGNTYQANYTFKLFADVYGSTVDLYIRLRERQPSRFGALIRDGNNNILSFSPEWFVELNEGKIRAKPMKGTLAVSGSKAADLNQDKKNRAENLMIVDLLRNDIGRISEVGSVKVPKLFEVERVGEIYQMTSTIESKIKKNIKLKNLLEAIYPCGSVTGAPKKKTMEILKELENGQRGFYCGSIGWLDPCSSVPEKLGNIMLSVGIRTAVISGHNLTFGIGSGITIDSNYLEEWKECLLKASFVVRLPSGVGLFETVRIEKGIPKFFKNHVMRLTKSAENFGIPCDTDELEELVQNKINLECRSKQEVYRLKMMLSPIGILDIEILPLLDIYTPPKIFWAADLIGKKYSTIDSTDPTFYHKTTNRFIYDMVWKKAEQSGGFDGIFLNEKGEVTEGGRTNLFIRTGDIWKTPPVSSGLLPGVMREILLEDKTMNIQEIPLAPIDIINAESVYISNSLRGLMRVDTRNLTTGFDMVK